MQVTSLPAHLKYDLNLVLIYLLPPPVPPAPPALVALLHVVVIDLILIGAKGCFTKAILEC